MTTPAEAVDILNRIHTADPTVLPALIAHRIPCNRALADDPTVQVGNVEAGSRNDDTDAEFEVGLLGIVNGLFGARANGWGWIGADFEGGHGEPVGALIRFVLLDDADVGITPE